MYILPEPNSSITQKQTTKKQYKYGIKELSAQADNSMKIYNFFLKSFLV